MDIMKLENEIEFIQLESKNKNQKTSFLPKLRNCLETYEILKGKRGAIQTKVANITEKKVIDLDPKFLAKQITLIDIEILRRVQEHEFKDSNWTKMNRMNLSPNISQNIDFFNYMISFVQLSILSQDDPGKRANVIQFFVNVCQHLSELCSFNMLKCVVTSLLDLPINRLNSTWAKVSKSSCSAIEVLSKLVSEENNFGYLRGLLKGRPSPAIPFLGMFLHDFSELEKPEQRQEAMDLFMYFKGSQYPFQHDDSLQYFILTKPFHSPKDMFNISVKAEPELKGNPPPYSFDDDNSPDIETLMHELNKLK
ncbi:ras GEF [Rozella allomycis CSF55]|uniref:Ras GEF n=1 Tax=Rozella allomycis (strain CSF55) TaxID=988480 RepID=A0A4P9YSG2_ROZAC|nr:ras GEF [Rozella allomycis CSF55]